ncbi:MAG: hypothetical protein AB7O47_09670 [Flavobacteriales bacterium]
MKKAIFIAIQIFICSIVFAQAPEKINYQAVARNLSGIPLVNQPINVKYEIRSGSSSGTLVYAESHSLTTNQFGLFTAEVGGGTPTFGTMAGIAWGTAPFYLYVEVDGDPMGITQLLSVPYALFAKESANGPAGLPGKNSLMNITPEPAGANCSAGGNKVESGLDDNNDGTLQLLEVDYTYFVCDGVAGPTGPQGPIGLTGPAGNTGPAGANGVGIDSTVHNANGTMTIYYSNSTSYTTNDLTGPPGVNGTTYFPGNGIAFNNDTIINIGDLSSSNELQTLSLNAAQDSIFITNGNGIQLPSPIPDTDWSQGIGVVYNNTDYIGIGTTNPLFSLDVVSSDTVVAAFRGNNPDFTAISLSNTNSTSNVGIILLTGSDTALLGVNPTDKMLILDNSISGGHITLNADSTIVSYAEVVGNIANARIYNKTNTIYNESDSIFNYSTTGTNVNVNQGLFLTDSLYVLGNNASNLNWVLANDGNGQARWTDPNLITSGGDQWGSQSVVTNSTLIGNGTIGSPLGVNSSSFITTEIDGDTLNELQTISASGGTSPQIDLSNGGGNVKILGTGGTTVNQSGNAITINSTSGTTYTAGTAISVLGDSITNLAPDQIITLQSAGATTVTGIYPSFTISSTDSVNDADANPTNELITSFSLNGTSDTIVLKEASNTFTIPKSSFSDGNGIYSGSGTLTTNTTVTQNANNITFVGGGLNPTAIFRNGGAVGARIQIDATNVGTSPGLNLTNNGTNWGSVNGTSNGLQLDGGSGANVGIGVAPANGKFVVQHAATAAYPTFKLNQTDLNLNRIHFTNTPVANKYWEIAAETDASNVNAGYSINYYNGSTYNIHFLTYGNGQTAINGSGFVPGPNKSMFDVFGATTLHDSLTINTSYGNAYTFPVVDGSPNFLMKTDGAGNLSWVDPTSLGSSGWSLTGNAGTNPTTNFIGTTDTNTLAFRTNNIERLRITNIGKIGIGTNAPKSMLQIGSRLHLDTVNVGGITYNLYGYNLTYNGSNFVRTVAGTGIVNYMGQDEFGVEIYGTGAAGTNATSTLGQFTIDTTSAKIRSKEGLDILSMGRDTSLYLRNNTANSSIILWQNGGGNRTGLKSSNTTSTDLLFTLPSDAGTNGFLLKTDGTGVMSWVDPSTFSGTSFWTQVGDSLFPTMLSNNVGIGTSLPKAKLHVEDGANLRPEVLLQTTAGNFKIGYRYKTALAEWSMGQGEATGQQFRITDIQSGIVPFVIEQGSGNIGVGTVSPSQRLHVTNGQILNNWSNPNGDANLYISNWNSGSGPGYNTGTLGQVTIVTSDAAESKYAIQGHAGGDGGSKYGMYATARGANGSNTGGYFSALEGTSNYGVNSTAFAAGSSTATAIYGTAQGNGTGATYGIYGQNASSSTGAAYAGYFQNMNNSGSIIYGLRSEVSSNSTNNQYAIRADVTGSPSAGIRYGVYSTVFGGTTNWAGYFDQGDVYIQNTLVLPTGAGVGKVLKSDATGRAFWDTLASTNDGKITLINNTGAVSVPGDIVVIGSGDNSFALTSTPGNYAVLGVVMEAVANGQPAKVAISGVVDVNIDGSSNVVRGQHCITGNANGKANGIAIPNAGSSIGVYLTSTAANGIAKVLLR